MISILRQEKDWIVVDKPAGISVHNDEDPSNLISELSQQIQSTTFFPVHRLDKETSGLQVFALNEKKAAELAQLFQNKEVQKLYQGVVAGRLPEKGTWLLPLSDKGEGWKNPAGRVEDRKNCETHFRLLKSSAYFSWMEFDIRTGRQHQIRKHCVLSGHALIGDSRYGNPKYNSKIQQLYGFNRMALHCSEMTLASSEKLVSQAPLEFELLFPKN